MTRTAQKPQRSRRRFDTQARARGRAEKPKRRARFDDFCDDDVVDDLVAAGLLGASVSTLRSWRVMDPVRGPSFCHVGALVRYSIRDLKRFLARNTTRTADDPAPADTLRKIV